VRVVVIGILQVFIAADFHGSTTCRIRVNP
jgi:hypothetical protein